MCRPVCARGPLHRTVRGRLSSGWHVCLPAPRRDRQLLSIGCTVTDRARRSSLPTHRVRLDTSTLAPAPLGVRPALSPGSAWVRCPRAPRLAHSTRCRRHGTQTEDTGRLHRTHSTPFPPADLPTAVVTARDPRQCGTPRRRAQTRAGHPIASPAGPHALQGGRRRPGGRPLRVAAEDVAPKTQQRPRQPVHLPVLHGPRKCERGGRRGP